MKTVLLFLLRVYRWGISPLLGQNCRFYPSCSHYAIDAINEHGALIGAMLAAVRLAKCNPWHPGGIDPVPKKSTDPAGGTKHACGCKHP
jgi:putative membrane protein insertion efficiency factor